MKYLKLFEDTVFYNNVSLDLFFDTLSNLYQRENSCVKYYCQESTFSFEIFKEKEGFVDYTSKPIYISEVYNFWRNEKTMTEILNDITTKIIELEIDH